MFCTQIVESDTIYEDYITCKLPILISQLILHNLLTISCQYICSLVVFFDLIRVMKFCVDILTREVVGTEMGAKLAPLTPKYIFYKMLCKTPN